MTQGQGETQKEENFTRKGMAEVIPEDENIIDVTTKEARKDKEAFQETWDLYQEGEVIPQVREIEAHQETEIKNMHVLHVNV